MAVLLLDIAGAAVDWCRSTELLQPRCSESTQVRRTVKETQNVVVKSRQGNSRQRKGGRNKFTADLQPLTLSVNLCLASNGRPVVMLAELAIVFCC